MNKKISLTISLALAGLALILALVGCGNKKTGPRISDYGIESPEYFELDGTVLRGGVYHLSDGEAKYVEVCRELGEGSAAKAGALKPASGNETVPLPDMIKTKYYVLADGTEALAGSVSLSGPAETAVFGITREKITLHWVETAEDGSRSWKTEEASPGDYNASSYVIETDTNCFILYLPKAYKRIEYNSIEYEPELDGRLTISKTDDGKLRLEMIAVNGGGDSADYYLACTKEPVFDIRMDYQRDFWVPYTNDGDGRLLYDNYYWISDEDYVPSGENIYSNCPACYLGQSYVDGSWFYPAAKGLALYVIDTMLESRAGSAYLPSYAFSKWLRYDYKIKTPYYDTRFNSDFAVILLSAVKYMGGEEFKTALGEYMDWYAGFADHYGWSFGNGIFVPDYYFKGMKTPHTALNHQLAEMMVLYRSAELLEKPELSELADRMMLAIEESADGWIMDNKDLHYCIFKDGSFGHEDYPYLTYDDMYNMQKLLESMGRERNPYIQKLMDSKKKWMDQNWITQYLH